MNGRNFLYLVLVCSALIVLLILTRATNVYRWRNWWRWLRVPIVNEKQRIKPHYVYTTTRILDRKAVDIWPRLSQWCAAQQHFRYMDIDKWQLGTSVSISTRGFIHQRFIVLLDIELSSITLTQSQLNLNAYLPKQTRLSMRQQLKLQKLFNTLQTML